ncbi:WGR domain-containing protein [Exiguobacterium sp.]|uniref:WGR domain-containing protein n=1 Tax=Exiguobacterium sp. TaxID=44751 RepID=UPI00263B6586|nr:WGR domain-containing protein [Exiguobacterium sp.]MCC5892036.1 WGR domain-containing protein [Exiguobacterium sp.]
MKMHLQHNTKFWIIRVGTDEFVVQYGKRDTVGKVQLKSFDTAEECKKEADKLVRQKLKKGYVEVEYDWDTHLYVDDPEVGPHPLTAHPAFMQYFHEDYYLDCTDEFAPFGSDEGADVLDMFGEALRKDRDVDFLEGAYAILSDWLEEDISTPDDWMQNGDRFACDVVILASAFASIKLTGHITDPLKRSAQEALTTIVEEVEPEERQRFRLINEQLAAFPVLE